MPTNPYEPPSNVVQRIREEAEALIGIIWLPFSSSATLTFRAGQNQTLVLQMKGVHFLATRQAVVGADEPPSAEAWEDWLLHYIDMLTDSRFLQSFLDGQLGFPTREVVYDRKGNDINSPSFSRPFHIAILAGCGHLDIVCESVSLVAT